MAECAAFALRIGLKKVKSCNAADILTSYITLLIKALHIEGVREIIGFLFTYRKDACFVYSTSIVGNKIPIQYLNQCLQNVSIHQYDHITFGSVMFGVAGPISHSL